MRDYHGGPTVYHKDCVISYSAICQHLDERYVYKRKPADRCTVEARKAVRAILAKNGGKVTRAAVRQAMQAVYRGQPVADTGGGSSDTALSGYLNRHRPKYAEA